MAAVGYEKIYIYLVKLADNSTVTRLRGGDGDIQSIIFLESYLVTASKDERAKTLKLPKMSGYKGKRQQDDSLWVLVFQRSSTAKAIYLSHQVCKALIWNFFCLLQVNWYSSFLVDEGVKRNISILQKNMAFKTTSEILIRMRNSLETTDNLNALLWFVSMTGYLSINNEGLGLSFLFSFLGREKLKPS